MKLSEFIIMATGITTGLVLYNKQKKIQHSKWRIRTIINQLNSGLVILSETGLIETMNPSMEEISGYWAEELVNRHIAELLITDKSNDEICRSLWDSNRQTIFESTLETKDGEAVNIELSAKPIKVKDGTKRLILDIRATQNEK